MVSASFKQAATALLATGFMLTVPLTAIGAGSKQAKGFTHTQTQAYTARAETCAAQLFGSPSVVVSGQTTNPALTFISEQKGSQNLSLRINATKGRIAAVLTAKTPTLNALILNDNLLDPEVDFGLATLQGRSPISGITQTPEAEALSAQIEESFLAFRSCMMGTTPATTTTAALSQR